MADETPHAYNFSMRKPATYFRCRWFHRHEDEPVLMYGELDDDRYEVRKVEVFRDGSKGFADREEEHRSRLGEKQLPEIAEINVDPQFELDEISDDEFQVVWENRRIGGQPPKTRRISLSAHGWRTEIDLIDAVVQALQGPRWHGQNYNALHDSIVFGSINNIEPPYEFIFTDTAGAKQEVRDAVLYFVERISEWRVRDHAEIAARIES